MGRYAKVTVWFLNGGTDDDLDLLRWAVLELGADVVETPETLAEVDTGGPPRKPVAAYASAEWSQGGDMALAKLRDRG